MSFSKSRIKSMASEDLQQILEECAHFYETGVVKPDAILRDLYDESEEETPNSSSTPALFFVDVAQLAFYEYWNRTIKG